MNVAREKYINEYCGVFLLNNTHTYRLGDVLRLPDGGFGTIIMTTENTITVSRYKSGTVSYRIPNWNKEKTLGAAYELTP